jgi:UDPglucose 6-dehydrogenase
MNIAIIGTGYVGLVSGSCLAEMGNQVVCVDIDKKKIKNLKWGVMPIYEPGLDEMVNNNFAQGRLHFVTSLKELPFKPTVYFVAVGTPGDEDGSADLQYVLQVAKDIGGYIDDYAVIVDKSTVPVGTAGKVKATIQKELDKRGVTVGFDVVSNPEFLKEGDAVKDFMHPDRVVIGTDSEKARKIMHEIYAPFTKKHERTIFMGIRDAEMTKYAANSMLATKISFMNEMACLCEKMDVDVENVRVGIGHDSRIGFSFIYPGCGYGGSCFPKDVKALIRLAREYGFEPKVLNAVEARNGEQKKILGQKIVAKFGEDLAGITIAVWGLAFKPETDDVRESSAAVFLHDVIGRGAKVKAYDPEAMEEAKKILPEKWFKDGKVVLVKDQMEAIPDVDVLVLITEWKQFRSPEFDKIKQQMKGNLIIDGRNQYDPEYLCGLGFEYMGIGR